jgi:hypothetical protein
MSFLSKDSGRNGLGDKIDKAALRVDAGLLHFIWCGMEWPLKLN